MIRAKQYKNKKPRVWTNKSFVDNQDGSMPKFVIPSAPKTKKPQPKKKSKSEQEVKANNESKRNQDLNVDSNLQGPNTEGPKPLQGPKKTEPTVSKKVDKISVFELCRTLAELKAMEENSNNNEPSPANEPFFASNLEYYPHLPQLLYSQEYQTFNDVKVAVCHGNLAQVKPPQNYDYRFVQEWRDGFMTEEQRQAGIRNQRALNAQRILREQRQELEQMPKVSSSFFDRLGEDKPPPQVTGVYNDWQQTCKDLGLQREVYVKTPINFPFCNTMRFATRHQELEGEQLFYARHQAKLKKKQDFYAGQQAKMKMQELEALYREKELIQVQLRNMRARAAQQMAQDKHAAHIYELMEPPMPGAAQAEDYDARQQADMKKAELESIRKEREVLQARLRNERAHTAQRMGREYKKQQLQLQYEFRFGRKDMAKGDSN